MSTDGAPVELWSNDTFDRDAAPHLEGRFADARAGLERLWRAVLSEGVQDDGQPTFTDFTLRLPGRAVSLPRDPFENPELALLRARRHEVRFVERLAALHEARLAERFAFAPYLALPVELPPHVTRVVEVLAATLGVAGALTASRTGWRVGEGPSVVVAARPPEWTVKVEGLAAEGRPVALEVQVTANGARRVVSDGSAGAQTLQDALSAGL